VRIIVGARDKLEETRGDETVLVKKSQSTNVEVHLTKTKLKSFRRSQLPHKSANLSFNTTTRKNKLDKTVLVKKSQSTLLKPTNKYMMWDKPRRPGLSHIMYLLVGFRKSIPPQHRQPTLYYYELNIKLTVLWGRWLSKTD
jgi:hypothetical protein